jgi:hypothetical protein
VKKVIANAILLGEVCLLPLVSCSPTRSTTNESSGPTVDVPEFAIAVKLSPHAEERLNSIHESIKVLALFDGDPLPGQGRYNPPNRDVFLGSAERLVGDENVARFDRVKVPLRDYKRLSDKNYYVTINTVSARKSDNNNLLDCDDPIDRRIESFKGKTIEVSCWLIGEPSAPIK